MIRTVKTRLSPVERLVLSLALLLGIVVLGTLGFVAIEGWGFYDSLYMTLITISTLGMKGSLQPDLSRGGTAWIMFLVVTGIISSMIALTTIVGMVVEGHMRSILGRKTLNRKISSLQQHVIVCGYGRMGRIVAENLLRRQTNLVVIDHSPEVTAQAEQDGLLYLLGDASEEAALQNAGIERAKGLITVLPTDADNVFVTLVARSLNPKLFIAARTERRESESRLIRAGANSAICPILIGAERLANILTRPGVVDFLDFAADGLDLEAEQFHIRPESKLVGKTIKDANLPREIGILIIAVKRKNGTTLFNPNPDTVLEADDTMIVTGRIGSMAQLETRYS